jgi:hypothetical protein
MHAALGKGPSIWASLIEGSDLEEIDLTAYEGRSVPMDVVLGRERTQKAKVIKQADGRTRKSLPKRYSARCDAEALTQLTAVLERRSARATARLDGARAVTMSSETYSKARLPKNMGGSLPRFSPRGENEPIRKI